MSEQRPLKKVWLLCCYGFGKLYYAARTRAPCGHCGETMVRIAIVPPKMGIEKDAGWRRGNREDWLA